MVFDYKLMCWTCCKWLRAMSMVALLLCDCLSTGFKKRREGLNTYQCKLDVVRHSMLWDCPYITFNSNLRTTCKHAPKKPNMAFQHPPFEDVFPHWKNMFFGWVTPFTTPVLIPLTTRHRGTVDFAQKKPRFCSFLCTPWLARGVKLVGRFGRFGIPKRWSFLFLEGSHFVN